MTRLRADYVFGTLSVAIPYDGTYASYLFSPGVARLPELVSGSEDFYAITLTDPVTGAYEVVHVDYHNPGSSNAHIVRGQEGTAVGAWDIGTSWVHGPTAADFIPPEAPSNLLSPKYKGSWVAETEYIVGDLVRYSNKLWEALVNDPNVSAVDGPTAEGQAGSPGPVVGDVQSNGSGFAAWFAQQWTFDADGTYDSIQARSLDGGGDGFRIGFATAKPDNATRSQVAWVCYADMYLTGGGQYAGNDLNSPLVVTAGQTLWMVGMRETGSSATVVAYRSGSPVGITVGPAFYADDINGPMSGQTTALHSVQVSGQETPGSAPVWGLALDLG